MALGICDLATRNQAEPAVDECGALWKRR